MTDPNDRHYLEYLARMRKVQQVEPEEEQPVTQRFPTLEAPVRILTAERPTCPSHSGIQVRLDHLEERQGDHETRTAALERRGADVAGKLLWVFVTALVCGAVSLVVALLTAQGGG